MSKKEELLDFLARHGFTQLSPSEAIRGFKLFEDSDDESYLYIRVQRKMVWGWQINSVGQGRNMTKGHLKDFNGSDLSFLKDTPEKKWSLTKSFQKELKKLESLS